MTVMTGTAAKTMWPMNPHEWAKEIRPKEPVPVWPGIIHVSVSVSVSASASVSVSESVCVSVSVSVCMCRCVKSANNRITATCVCMHVCMYVCILCVCVYIHTQMCKIRRRYDNCNKARQMNMNGPACVSIFYKTKSYTMPQN
jgi:hypothetical protein